TSPLSGRNRADQSTPEGVMLGALWRRSHDHGSSAFELPTIAALRHAPIPEASAGSTSGPAEGVDRGDQTWSALGLGRGGPEARWDRAPGARASREVSLTVSPRSPGRNRSRP